MKSPIATLCEVLKQVRDSSKTYRVQLSQNETATRAVLVDPVLRALGWDIEKPTMVEVERTVHRGRIDYVLVPDEDKRVLIEAKKLNSTLTEHFSQIVQYAVTEKSESVFITDGVRWNHFTNIGPRNHTPTKEINLLDDSELFNNAAYLIQNLDAALIAPELDSINPVDEMKDKITDLINRMRLIENSVPDTEITLIPGGIESKILSSSHIESDNWLPLDNSWDAKKKKPQQFKLPNNQIVTVRSWTQVLVAACEFALTENGELFNQLPIPSKTGALVKLISRESPPENLNFDTINVNGETLYVCTNYSAASTIGNSAYILEKVPKTNWKNQPMLRLRDQS
jgi:hypothetical protein